MGLEETPWNDNVANIVMVHDYAGCSCGWCHENETIIHNKYFVATGVAQIDQ